MGDLKQYDGKRLLARLIDSALLILPAAIVITMFDNLSPYACVAAVTIVYFFLCEATMAQSLGKQVMGLRVMTRDGRRPSIGAIAIRSLLRAVEDNLLGLIVMVLSGKRRQRIGDMLAGTVVGSAASR